MLDDGGVLALQTLELDHLLRQVAPADVDHAPALQAQAGDARRHDGPEDLLPLAHDALAQGTLQIRQAAGFEQLGVVGDLCDQALLRRHGDHIGPGNTQDLRRRHALAIDLRSHLLRGAQGVPQGVYLVQHHQAYIRDFRVDDQMLTPDGQVGLGDTGVRPQDEHHCLRLRQQADRELGLCTDGVEPRGVEDHQALLQQGVGDIDQRMAPAGDLDQALRVDHRVVFRCLVVPQAERAGVVLGDLPGLGDHFQGGGQLLRVVDVEVDAGPLFRGHAPFHQGLGLQPGFDRQ